MLITIIKSFNKQSCYHTVIEGKVNREERSGDLWSFNPTCKFFRPRAFLNSNLSLRGWVGWKWRGGLRSSSVIARDPHILKSVSRIASFVFPWTRGKFSKGATVFDLVLKFMQSIDTLFRNRSITFSVRWIGSNICKNCHCRFVSGRNLLCVAHL